MSHDLLIVVYFVLQRGTPYEEKHGVAMSEAQKQRLIRITFGDSASSASGCARQDLIRPAKRRSETLSGRDRRSSSSARVRTLVFEAGAATGAGVEPFRNGLGTFIPVAHHVGPLTIGIRVGRIGQHERTQMCAGMKFDDGPDRPATHDIARRLVERNVRFVHIVTGPVDVLGEKGAGTRTRVSIRTILQTPRRWRNPSLGYWPICSRADCSNPRWWCGRRSLAGRRGGRAATGATTIPEATRNGWPAAASRGLLTARPTNSA